MENAPFCKAIEEFISEVKSQEDTQTPFYREVLARINDGNPKQEMSTYINECSDGFNEFVKSLEEKHISKSKTMFVMNKLKPLMIGLKQFTDTCDAMIQAAPAAAQLVFGGAKLVIQLSHNFYNCFDTILSIMEDIGLLLQCYHLMSRSYQASEEMQKLLVEAYKNIVYFWQKASTLLSRKKYKTMLIGIIKPLDSQWQKCRQRLQTDSTRIQMLAMATEADIRRQKEEGKVKTRGANLKKQIIQWIKSDEQDCNLDTRRKVDEKQELQQEETCDWLFNNKVMQDWMEAKETTSIWYNAPPGAGKTIMASAVARKLQDKGLKTIVYFYSFDDTACRKVSTLLRFIALQLVIHCDQIPSQVQRAYQEDIENHCFKLDHPRVLIKVIETLLKQTKRIHIIIDGIDECENEVEHFQAFSHLLRTNTLGIVKWFFTSRPLSSIRAHMKQIRSHELTAPQEDLLDDIRRYVHQRIDDPAIVNHWVEQSEGNFQWIVYMLSIIEGQDLTCDDEIDEELSKFPKGLSGCYLRTLTQLSNRSEKHQDLAQKIFTMIVGAAQPLRLTEISHALAASFNAGEFSLGRVPRLELVEELCSNLVLFDHTGPDPLLRFAHKSIHDFFLQSPDTLHIPQELQKYFVTVKKANLELGMSCLRYLNCPRYQTLQDIGNLVEQDDHAFIKHAATFWYLYLNKIKPTDDVYQQVIEFVQSFAFWTCVQVQCRISRYLWVRYFKQGYSFAMDNLSCMESSDEDDFAYPVPLPEWLDRYGDTGAQIVESFYNFIKDWHPTLISHQADIKYCVTNPVWQKNLPGLKHLQSEQVQSLSPVDEETKWTGFYNLLLRDITSEDGELILSTFGNQITGNGLTPEWTSLRMTGNSVTVEKQKKGETTFLWGSNEHKFGILRGSDCNTVSLVNSANLSVEDYAFKNGTIDLVSNYPSTSIKERRNQDWNLVSKIYHPSNLDHVVVQFNRHTNSKDDHDFDRDSGIGMTNSEDSEYDDSDDADSEEESGFTDSETSLVTCLLFARKEKSPIWYSWKSTSLAIEAVSAFHPVDDIAVWSSSAHELCVLDLDSGKVHSTILPEPPEIQFSKLVAVRKEFYFLKSGKTLAYLLFASKQHSEATIKHTLCMSYFDFTLNDDKTISLQRSQSIQHLSYECLGSIESGCDKSLILTSWTENSIHLALPPLISRPRIIRLKHPTSEYSSKYPFKTLQIPVCFPFTTISRDARIKTLDVGNKKHLILSLNAESGPSIRQNKGFSRIRQPPTVMLWKLSKKDWRDWDDIQDGQSEKLKSTHGTYSQIRGSFIAADRKFSVPIRSGLNWTRKGVLSCR
jgi:hypothetical protein